MNLCKFQTLLNIVYQVGEFIQIIQEGVYARIESTINSLAIMLFLKFIMTSNGRKRTEKYKRYLKEDAREKRAGENVLYQPESGVIREVRSHAAIYLDQRQTRT